MVIMRCKHLCWITAENDAYSLACVMLSEKQGDVTIIDVGCGDAPYLFEIRRHLQKHGVNAYTIGIDKCKMDVLVDEFIHSDVLNVNFDGRADVVFACGIMGYMKTADEFQTFMHAVARMMKPNGKLFIHSSFNARDDPSISLTDVRVMTKYETVKHACCFTGCTESKIHCMHGQTELPAWSDTQGWTFDY